MPKKKWMRGGVNTEKSGSANGSSPNITSACHGSSTSSFEPLLSNMVSGGG